MKHEVVLDNPGADFWTPPLGLVAVTSALGDERSAPVIVDGRLEDARLFPSPELS